MRPGALPNRELFQSGDINGPLGARGRAKRHESAFFHTNKSWHAGPLNTMRIAALFKNIPQQLARESNGTHKFLFKNVLTGRSTYDVLEGPIEWLCKAGLIHRVPICRKIQVPLSAYAE